MTKIEFGVGPDGKEKRRWINMYVRFAAIPTILPGEILDME